MARINLKHLITLSVATTLMTLGARPAQTLSSADDQSRLSRLENQFETLRTLLKIPGLSAVIVKDQKVVWAKGFGFADLEARIPATPETPYVIASLTKTFAATLVLQLVEQGKLDLNEPISKYSADFKDETVKIKHLLSHTSEGTPGEHYQYNGSRYNYLTAVLEKVTGKTFRELLVKTFLDPLGMSSTVPGHDLLTEKDKWSVLGEQNLNRYPAVLAKLAQPHRLYGEEIVQTPYPPRGIGAAAGLISTVIDLAKYEAAVDRNQFLKKQTQEQAWTPFVSNNGQPLPHGLGWFVRPYQGQKLIWHYGYWPDSFSATLVKVPAQKLTLVLLANSDALSAPFYYTGGIETNAFACAFLRLFVFEDSLGRSLNDPDWSRQSREFSSELARLGKQANGYDYDCEQTSHAAVMKWHANRTFAVSQEGNRLTIDIPRSSKSELFPESESKFFLKVADVEVTFVKDDKGQVIHIDIHSNGQDLRARRIK